MTTRTCLKCGAVNETATHAPMEDCPKCGAIYDRVDHAVAASAAKKTAEKRKLTEKEKKETFIGLAVLAALFAWWIWPDASTPSSAPSSPAAPVNCSANDAQCLGKRDFIEAYPLCTRNIEAHAALGSRWTNGLLGQRFNQIGWYLPGEHQIIYTGNEIEVQTEFGAWVKRSYFCVWDTEAKMVMKVGINN